MPRILNTVNHTTVGHGCTPVVCTAPTNQRVTTMGEKALVLSDSFLPHNYCGTDPTHVGLLVASNPRVTINNKPVGLELDPLSCGDLALCVGVGKVFVSEPLSRSSGAAADPEERVVISDFPKIVYPRRTLSVTYETLKDSFGNITGYKLDSISPLSVSPTDAYTPLNILDRESEVLRTVNNYPGPPITTRSGAEGLPAYAVILSAPIQVSIVFTNINPTLDETTLEVSNIENVLSLPSNVSFSGLQNLKNRRYNISYRTVMIIGGQSYTSDDTSNITIGLSVRTT